MTVREIMTGLSDVLLCDERILSMPERELLANLARCAQSRADLHGSNVKETIASAIGEVLAERAYAILGDSVLQKLLLPVETPDSLPRSVRDMGTPPSQPPSPPGPDVGPRPPGPTPPGISAREQRNPVLEPSDHDSPALLAARPVILDEFLAPAELDSLIQYALEHESDFQVSEVISPGVPGGAVDYDQRRSRVLLDLGKHKDSIVSRLTPALAPILPRLGHEPFAISRMEAQITASNHGDYFRWHSDNAQDEVASREITFVYFFHREPRRFRGGELRIYDSRLEATGYVPTPNYRGIVPEQNQLVLFNSALAHEITPVDCASGSFADSRFTVNGWLHRQ